jgi:hypothetical protein
MRHVPQAARLNERRGFVIKGVHRGLGVAGLFEFEGLPERGHVSLDTSIFEELPDSRTRLTIHSVFKSVADRDGIIASGMENGVVEGYERLDALLAHLGD